jgi:hypothetical protein
MSRLRLAIVNHWDTGTLVASSAVSTLPVENTRVRARGSPWRSTASSAQYMTNVEAGNLAANFVAFFNHNLAGGTARWRLYSDAGMTTTVLDTGALAIPAAAAATAGANHGLGGNASAAQAVDDLLGNVAPFVAYFAATVFRAARLDITAGAIATAAGYQQVGRVWCGMYHESEYNPRVGAQLGLGSNTQANRTRGGSLRTNRGANWRKQDIDMAYIIGDRAFWSDVLMYSEVSRDVFYAMFPGDSDARLDRDYTLNGQFVALDPLIYDIAYRSKHVVIEEL